MDPVSLFPDFKEFLKLMNSANVRYLVLGGYAVNYHGHHRTTGDLDVWIAIDAENAKRVSQVLQQFGFASSTVPPSQFLEIGKVFRMGRKPVRIEILTQPSGVEFQSCYTRRINGELDGIQVPLISLDDLKANKRAANRLKDQSDFGKPSLRPHSEVSFMDSSSGCRREGCTRARAPYSIFCDEHHHEHLVRVGVIEPISDPCALLVKACHDDIEAHRRGSFSEEQTLLAIFDSLLHAGKKGLAECFERSIDALSCGIAEKLLAYATANPGPRMWCPLPSKKEIREKQERQMLSLQADLQRLLRQHISLRRD